MTRGRLKDGRRLPTFQVERAIFEREDLKAYEKLVLCYLAMRANSHAECWPSYSTIARDCGISKSSAMRTVKGLEDKGLLTKTQRHDQKGDYTSNLFRLFSADPPTFPPSQNPAASDAPAGGVTETPALSQWKDGVFTGTARVVSHSDQNVSQSELSPTNDRAVVASTDIPDLDAKAQVALENALARGVEIVNPVAYKDGVRRNLLAQAQGALEKQAQDAHRKAEAERRANCTTCGGDGWIDTSADGYIECPDCAPAAAR